MDKNYNEKNINIYEDKDELFLNEYDWESTKEEFVYFFKIRLNTNNTILFSCSTININNEKIVFENNYSLSDLHIYEKFKNNDNVNDIYIFLLTMIQDTQFEFEPKLENEVVLTIKPYTNCEKAFEFILPRKQNNNKKCEICDRVHSGINYLRFIRDNNHNHNIISSNNNINYNINCNYSNINSNRDIDDKNIISKIMEEINYLKKENYLKNEQINYLKKELIEQNRRLSKENQHLREEINNINSNNININNNTKNDGKNNGIAFKIIPINKINYDKNKDNSPITLITPMKINKEKKIFLKTFKVSYEMFIKNPNELKYNCSIVNNLSAKGVNDIFEVFISTKDNQAYLISKNAKTHCLDVILLNNCKIINSLQGHKNTITMVRYFMNYKGKNEYLISADIEKNVIVWDINDNYKILHFIKTEYIDVVIYSCYIFFDNFDNNYIFTSCGLNRYKKNNTTFTKMYSFKDGNFIKNMQFSDDNNTYYLLVWYNENNKTNFLIELCEEKITITNFVNNELYKNLLPFGFKILKYYSGFIHRNNIGRDLLCCSTSNGCIVIWDLLSLQLFYFGRISKVELYNIIPWNKKYIIISGGSNKSIKIFDIDILKEVNSIKTEYSSNINCVKKILHPIYGESLLSSGNDHQIRLWNI